MVQHVFQDSVVHVLNVSSVTMCVTIKLVSGIVQVFYSTEFFLPACSVNCESWRLQL
jgi:hypothetical protein